VLSRLNLIEVFDRIPDPRKRRGIRHRVPVILAVAPSATMAGARSFTAIGQWAREVNAQVAGQLGMGWRRPEESTFRRVLCALDAEVLDWVTGAWTYLRSGQIAGRRVLSFDGKTVRGARGKDGKAPHLLSGIVHGPGTVITQTRVPDKSSEIPALRGLLDRFALSGVLVIADALHTQRDTAREIVARQGHYLLTVKRNQLGLLRACSHLPWTLIPSVTWTDKTRGRRIRRTIRVIDADRWVDFPGAAQIAQLTRKRVIKGKRHTEVVYLICSLPAVEASPEQLATWIQGHWSIENRVHWVRDVTWDEDRQTARTGSGPQVMASLRNIAISLLRLDGTTNIAAAQRTNAWHPERPAQLILNTAERTLP
jgi:predicted transposase YbfD/YdcC